MKRWCVIILVVALLVVGVLPAVGQDSETDPLLAMLGMVPDDDTIQGQGWATIRYTDFQALYESEGIEDARKLGNTDTLLKLVPLPGMLMRIVAGPEALQYVFAGYERMPEVVGFEWITDVDRSLEYGAPPSTAIILNGSFDDDAVGAALSARGFEETDVSGIPVWHRFEDAEISMQDRETADPFGGHLGLAARIAVWPDYLANSRFWDMTNGIIAAAQGEQPSLADNPNYRALAEAITAPEGWLIQALFFDVADMGFIPGDPAMTREGQTDPTESYGVLMPYALAVLADRQEGQDQVHLIGLVYPDTDSASAAAEEVARRMSAFALPNAPDESLVERFGAQVSTRVYESESMGLAVAVIEVRYPLPADRTDPETNRFITGGMLYRAWAQAIMQRAFFLLSVKAE